MLAFYELNAMTLIVILITAIIIYSLLHRFVPEDKKSMILNICVALSIGIILSIIISYVTIESDNLLTVGYWE